MGKKHKGVDVLNGGTELVGEKEKDLTRYSFSTNRSVTFSFIRHREKSNRGPVVSRPSGVASDVTVRPLLVLFSPLPVYRPRGPRDYGNAREARLPPRPSPTLLPRS